MSETLLQVNNLHTHYFTFAGVVKAVNGISLTVSKGKTFGLVGESGCGKSVTARSIMRLVKAPGKIVSGEIMYNGQDLLKLNESQMRDIRGNSISMIFQEPMISLNPIFRIGNQIAEAICKHKNVSMNEAMNQSIEMLKKVGIPDPEKRIREFPHQMSGGMRQRVMIAIALSCDPQLIIADEPTTALDVTIQAQIMDLMNYLREETDTSILMITHDLGVIAEMAQSIAVMYAGKIVEFSDSREIFDTPKHPYTIGLLNSIPKIDEPVPMNKMLNAIPGVVPNLLKLPQGCAFYDRCTRVLDICREKEPPQIETNDGCNVRCWIYG